MFFSVITKNSAKDFQLRIQLLLKDEMGLRMINFNIMGVHWKNLTFREVYEKAIHRR